MVGWTDEAVEARMRRGWRGGLKDGTPCGNGSMVASTANIRQQLPGVAAQFGIRSVCDAGAGDLHWTPLLAWDVEYRPFDLVPRSVLVEQIDITQTALPVCDAILCRHVLIHLDPPRVAKALALFGESAEYLLASQYDGAAAFDPGNQFNRTDLRPVLGEPVLRIKDSDSDLALWRL